MKHFYKLSVRGFYKVLNTYFVFLMNIKEILTVMGIYQDNKYLFMKALILENIVITI